MEKREHRLKLIALASVCADDELAARDALGLAFNKAIAAIGRDITFTAHQVILADVEEVSDGKADN